MHNISPRTNSVLIINSVFFRGTQQLHCHGDDLTTEPTGPFFTRRKQWPKLRKALRVAKSQNLLNSGKKLLGCDPCAHVLSLSCAYGLNSPKPFVTEYGLVSARTT